MSIITDIGKTVRRRIVGGRVKAPKAGVEPEHGPVAAAPAERANRRLRHAGPRKAGSDHMQHAGLGQQMGASAGQLVSATTAVSETTKSDTVLRLLTRPEGASLADLMAATFWQRHSVRGFLSGTVRRKLGLNLFSDITNGSERRYRIQSEVDTYSTEPTETVSSGLPSTADGVEATTGSVVG